MKRNLSNPNRLKKIRTILKEMNEVDYRCIEIAMSMSAQARMIIKKFHIDKKEFCEKVRIKERNYKAYINGAYEFSLHDMASLQALYCEKDNQRYEEELAKKLKTEFVNVKTD